MDIGANITCQCGQVFQMYMETHGVEWKKMLGRCPCCSKMNVGVPTDLTYPEHPKGVTITPVPYYAGD